MSRKTRLPSVLLLAGCVIAAPPDDLRRAEVRAWGSSQGLPEENIYSIAETQDGYIWLASHDGLIRFDGLHFLVLNPGAGSGFRDKSLSGAVTVNNTLWVGGRDYVAYARADAFHSFSTLNFLASGMPRKPQERYGIANMQALADGTIFFRRAEGIYRLKTAADGRPPEVPQLYIAAPGVETLTGFHHGPSGSDWGATPKGVFRRDGNNWVPLPGPIVESATLLESRDGTLWAFGANGLFKFNGKRLELALKPPRIVLDPLRALFEDAAGDIWVGLIGAVARIRHGRAEVLPLEQTMQPGDFVKVINQTRDGAIWATTNWGRLIRIDAPVFHTIDTADGLGEDSISAVRRDDAGRTWAATRAKGIFRADAAEFHSVPDTSQGIFHAMELAGPDQLLFANVIGLWLHTESRSTLLAPAPSQVMNHYRAFSPNYGTHIYYDDSQALHRIALPVSTPVKMEKVADIPMVRSILEDATGVWAVSWDRGLYHVSKQGAITVFPVDEKHELRAFTLFELSPSHFLVGTSGGVMLYDRNAKKFARQAPLFPDDQVFHIESDRRSHVWFAGRRALLTASCKALLEYAAGETPTVLPMRLTAQQGLSSVNFGLGTSAGSFFDKKGEMWLASVGGLIHFRPFDIVGLDESIPSSISAVLADGKPVPISDSIAIPAGTRRVEIRYSVLNRAADRHPIYRYRLVGDSPEWIETAVSQADFTNLPPGSFTFQVQARLASLDWSPPAAMKVDVAPYWHQLLPVRLAAVALIVFLVFLSVQWRGRQIRARNLELEAHVRVRTEELAHARDEAEAAARAKADFLAAMSHEIRTPMNGVIGMVEVLKHTPLNTDQQELLNVISQSGDALIGILNDILDFSKIDAGALSLESAAFHMPTLVRQSHALFARQAAASGLSFQYSVAPDVPEWVSGDGARIRQILLNLLSNALKFTPNGTVRLAVTREPDGPISFAVSDTGIGIPAEKLDSIFGAFTQAETSTTRRFGGTGLGLAISQRLAVAMEGTLNATSTLGQGSSFVLTLPLPRATPPDSALRQNLAEPRFAQRVLVVEDNAVNRQVAQRLLANLGCHVTLANDGQQGVEIAGREHFDLILMDCHMPGMDGYEATRRILARSENAPRIVALTAGALAEDRQRCYAAGMTGFLTKPIRSEDLRHLLAACATLETAPPVS